MFSCRFRRSTGLTQYHEATVPKPSGRAFGSMRERYVSVIDRSTIRRMSRAARRVPPDWVHPKDERGEYIPLRDGAEYARDAARWDEEADRWQHARTASQL